jgi:hypothetical protein
LLQLNIHFTTVFELRAAAEEALVFRPKQEELGKSRLAQIARYVAATGQVGENNTFNPLKPKLVQIIFKNAVRTAKKTLHFTIKKINWLTLFKEIIAVYSENHTKHINT